MRLNSFSKQSGVALAMALIILVVLTVLGVAAMRSSKLAQRLSDNAQSRMSALQQAQSLADDISATSANLPVLPGTNYFLCFLGTPPPSNAPQPQFGGTANSTSINSNPTCASYTDTSTLTSYTLSGTLTLDVLGFATPYGSSNPLNMNTYGMVVRVPAADGSEFIVSSAVRSAENSGRDYNFASFVVTGGYDASAASTATTTAQGVAEVNEGVYVRHALSTGVTNQ